ncbi:hypothetical protein FISHEDRAFT_52951 [Fistulina hepatica ATCC 64428]|nr:hypothetical protein FISHEDRAFT_52951 [Fistulina hepatica ATCC 64428]
MADHSTTCLCVQIIGSHFGPLTAKVVQALLSHGRLTVPQICRHTSLKPRQVRAAVLILIQHNILWHAETDDGEVFEVNVDECVVRLRLGRYIDIANKIHGEAAAEIVSIILDHGKLRPPDILARLPKTGRKSTMLYKQTIFKLVSSSYLKASTVLAHTSPQDKRIQYEEEEKSKLSNLPSSRELREAKEVAAARLRREQEDAEKIGLKHKAKEASTHRISKINDEVYFRVNFDKFNLHIRNELIVNAAKERFNISASRVISALLKITEPLQRHLSEPRSDAVTVGNIAVQFTDDEDLASGLTLSSKPSNTTCTKHYLSLLAHADNPLSTGRAAAFVSFDGSKTQVEFETVGRRMRRQVYEAVTREKYGVEGLRIVRLLLDIGKMDEKEISKVVMMAAKDVRPLLSAMAADSLVATQEVPKTADRNPTRTFYLWYVDLRKAYAAILRGLYQTLYNIGQRRQAEEEEPVVRAVLEKRQRTDVSQDESLLTRLEREVLAEWERKQIKLSVLEMRVDETLFIIRDLSVLGMEDQY